MTKYPRPDGQGFMCPDCGQPMLNRANTKKYSCETSGCPVIYVKIKIGYPHNVIARIARAVTPK